MEALLGVVALPDESWLTFSVETLLNEACGVGEPAVLESLCTSTLRA